MDINLKKIQEKFSHLTHHSSALHTRAIATPTRDWKIILACTGVGIICAAIFSGLVYLSVRDTVTPEGGVVSASARSKISDAEINKVLSAFGTREVVHGQVRAGLGGLVDPSR